MKTFDITLEMGDELPSWPDHNDFEIIFRKQISAGDRCNLSEINTSAHFGTHVDAPGHYVEGGEKVSELKLDLLLGECQVIALSGQGKVSKEELAEYDFSQTSRLLVKTSNSNYLDSKIFQKDYRAFSAPAMEELVAQGIKVLGLDYFSIAPYDDLIKPHQIFLSQGECAAIEGLDLRDIEPGLYELICLPMKIKGAYGAPARVVLRSRM